MKNAIILHGKPSREEYYDPQAHSMSNAHWIPWMQGQLLKHDIWAATPEIPDAFNPQYGLWCKEFERFDVTPDTILVGHSCGAGFLVKWLSLHKDVRVGKVVLVAPSLAKNWDDRGFFSDFEIDSDLASRTDKLTIFNSSNDHDGIQVAVKEIRDKITNIEYVEFKKYGHFCESDMGTVEFPELRDHLLKT